MSTSPHVDFISGSTRHSQDSKPERDLSLCHAYPTIGDRRATSGVLAINDKRAPRVPRNGDAPTEQEKDGLYVSEDPFTDKLIKPYRLDDVRPLDYESRARLRGRLVEIAIRDVRVHPPSSARAEARTLEVASVSISFRGRLICRTNGPFNRKLHKLLIRDRDSQFYDLSIAVHARHGGSSVPLPLPLPGRCVKDHKVEINFAIGDGAGGVHSGTVVCTVSLSTCGATDDEPRETSGAPFYRPSDDPNDPRNALSLSTLPQPRRRSANRTDEVGYFLLQDPALIFDTATVDAPTKTRSREFKAPDIVVTEESALSLLDASFRNLFQINRPFRPSSSSVGTRRHRAIGKTILSVTVLRAVEVPVREESALVSPLLEVEWAGVVRATSIADGPAPVWHQTMHYELPRQNPGEHCVKFRLYDQHPVWGQQWLGETRIPLERHRNYQELERWIALSPLLSPVLSFGYVQASPGQSHTRIYVLMKMEQPGNARSVEANAIDALSKGVQRCLATPCRVAGVETPDDAARLAMLLPSLPVHYGPVTSRQALNVNKADHYGRAALLATLLQGFGLQPYVLLGSSQISRWTAFVLTVEKDSIFLWDPEIGERYNLSDSRCSLMKVSRLINHSGIWENLQKSILPHNLRYNVAIGKDWRPLVPVAASSSSSSIGARSVQTLEPTVVGEDEDAREKESAAQMEQHLRDKLSDWRGALGLTTVFNRHAVTVLRGFVAGIPNDGGRLLDKRDLKQLYRAYHAHGFLLNLRQTTLDELTEQMSVTKVHGITGPVEFALVCRVQRYIGKTCSIWLALAILRSRR